MRTLEQYLPVMREADGRWYWPRSSSIGTLVAVALLLVAIVYAWRYPTMKTEEAAQRLERFNELTLQSTQHTQAALSRLQVLVANQPEWLRDLAAEQVGNLHAHLALVKPLTRAQVLQQAQAQQEAYESAQQLIEASPFNGLTKQQVPLSTEGKAYLDALEVQRPSRFDYQRLSDGVLDALPILQAGFKLQAQAETLAHQLDLRLNGDKATPLGPAATTAQQAPAELQSEQPAVQPDVPINALTSALRQAERDAERQQRQAELEVQNQQHQAEREDRQAEQQAQRKQQQAQRAAAQQQRDAERLAKAAAEARQRAERETERQAAAAQRQAQAAAEAKRRECTANLVARAKCAAQGYNPLTGMRN
ncbi:MAG: hypothetical protein ACRCTL_21505 [Pseudomonas sp.]